MVGLLGTDGITRSIENLVAKARALTEEGITAYALTSAYGYPPITMTGSVEKDIMMVPPIIGVKVAVSDHRSSNPTGEELIRLATAARRAGLLSCTPGLVTMHDGLWARGDWTPFSTYWITPTCPPRTCCPPTCTGPRPSSSQGVELVRRGGFIDFTAGCDDQELEVNADKLAACLSQEGVTADHVTMSSDAYGSQPRFDDKGECIGLTYASPKYLHRTIQGLVKRGMALEEALKLLTTTPANILGKTGVKGCVAQGADADLLVLGEGLAIEGLFARGRTALWQGETLMKGKFE